VRLDPETRIDHLPGSRTYHRVAKP
jgi:hypothetical protein